jgi:hypothetical protein
VLFVFVRLFFTQIFCTFSTSDKEKNMNILLQTPAPKNLLPLFVVLSGGGGGAGEPGGVFLILT